MSTLYSFFKAEKKFTPLPPKLLDKNTGKTALYCTTVHWYEIGAQNSSLNLSSVIIRREFTLPYFGNGPAAA